MARFKNHLLVVLGFAFAGAIGVAFGTGTAQAIVATLVEVVNPTTSPVPSLNVTDPGRVPYQSIFFISCVNATDCSFSLGTVPAGHRVVVQHISGTLSVSSLPAEVEVTVKGTQDVGLTQFLAPIGISGFSLFDQPTLFYVDPTDTISVSMNIRNATGSGVPVIESGPHVTVTGYELDCTVAACAPIATQ
jgi:hypothetical protein